ncbi:MAG: hypothetical protein U1E76_06975 [Planctomycetota bacterium]
MLTTACLPVLLWSCSATDAAVAVPAAQGVLVGRAVASDQTPVMGHVEWEPMDQHGRAHEVEVAALDAAGRFRFEVAPAFASRGRLTIRAPGFRTVLLCDVSSAPGLHRDVGTIVLERGERLLGHVLDAAGKSVAGALVLMNAQWDLAAFRPNFEEVWEATLTDADGRYAFDTLSPARHHLWILPSEGSAITLERAVYPSEQVHESVLAPGKVLHGTLVDTQDRPVAGEPLRLEGYREIPERWLPPVTTDASGHFDFSALPLVPAKIAAPHDASWQLGPDQTVDAEQTAAVLRVPNPGGFALTLRDAVSGEPIPVAHLQVEERSSSRPQTAPLGDLPARFIQQEFRCAMPYRRRFASGPDRFALHVRAPHYVPATIGYFDAPSDRVLELECRLERETPTAGAMPTGVAGVVRTSDGKMVAGATVALNSAVIQTDSEGRFVLPETAGIDGTLQVTAGSLGAFEQDGAFDAALQITLERTASLTVRVDGKASSLVQVDRGVVKSHFALYLTPVARAFVTDQITIDGLLPGTYFIKDEPPGYAPVKTRVELRSGEHQDLELHLHEVLEQPRIGGRVTVSGEPLRYRRVFVERAFQSSSLELATVAETLSDRDGRYALSITQTPGSQRRVGRSSQPLDWGYLVVEGPRSAVADSHHQEGGMARARITWQAGSREQRDLDLVLGDVTVSVIDENGMTVRHRPMVRPLGEETTFIRPRGVPWTCVPPKVPFELDRYTFTLAAGPYRLSIRSRASGERSVDFEVSDTHPIEITVPMSSVHELRVSTPDTTHRVDLYRRDQLTQKFSQWVTGAGMVDTQAVGREHVIGKVQPGAYLLVAWQQGESRDELDPVRSRVHQYVTVVERDPATIAISMGSSR